MTMMIWTRVLAWLQQCPSFEDLRIPISQRIWSSSRLVYRHYFPTKLRHRPPFEWLPDWIGWNNLNPWSGRFPRVECPGPPSSPAAALPRHSSTAKMQIPAMRPPLAGRSIDATWNVRAVAFTQVTLPSHIL